MENNFLVWSNSLGFTYSCIAIISHIIREVVVSDTNSRQFSFSIMGKLWLEHHFLLLGGPSTSTSIPVPSL